MTTTAYRDKAGRLRVRIQVIEELFHFISMEDWIQSAQLRFRNHGHTATTAVCVDRHGMVCVRGKQFKVASYPVRVYAVDEPPFKPQVMIGQQEPVESEGLA